MPIDSDETTVVMAGPRRRRPDQLAAGPHHMSRAEVEANQTARIVEAMRGLVAERGYERTKVGHVVKRAGVSRRTFYDLQDGREGWFLVVCAEIGARLLERVRAAAAENGREGAEQRAIGALIDFCGEDPSGARTCFVETLAANDETRAWRSDLIDELTMAIATAGEARDPAPDPVGQPEETAAGRRGLFAARAAVGAVLELAGRNPEQLDREAAVALVATLLAYDRLGGAPS